MKRILSIAVVICLAITMTCSSFAVTADETVDSLVEVEAVPETDSTDGAVLMCPYCFEGNVLSTYTTTVLADVRDVECTHGISGATDTLYYYEVRYVTVCSNCGQPYDVLDRYIVEICHS